MKLAFIYINFSLSSKPLTFYFEEYISRMINIYKDCKLFLGKTVPWVFIFITHVNIQLHIYMIVGAKVCVRVCLCVHIFRFISDIFFFYLWYFEGYIQLCIFMVDFPNAQTSFCEWNVYMVIYEKISCPRVILRVELGKGTLIFILGAGRHPLLQFPSPPSLSQMHLATFLL